MRSNESRNGRPFPQRLSVHAQAGEWLHRLLDTDADPDEPFPDPVDRQNAFLDWVGADPARVLACFEIMEVERRVGNPDPQHLIQIQALLESTPANVIQLYEGAVPDPASTETRTRQTRPKRRILLGIAAAIAMCAIAATVYFEPFARNAYATSMGEQRTCKLPDGSVVVLNTDTQVQVDYSHGIRALRLLKGEALFLVEHDGARPFIVSAGNAEVRAVGTEFNVRRRGDESTEVAVVEGTIQVSTDAALASANLAGPGNSTAQSQAASSTPLNQLRLSAGERVRISAGSMKVSASRDVADVLAWRQRRLSFNDTPLADVAAEFNRYNHLQIHVVGAAAQAMLMTGIFDADHPQAIILFAQKNEALIVQPDGENWVIRSR